MSINFSSGSFDSTSRVFTTTDGKKYYIPATSDKCGASPLNQTCNTQACAWDPWQDASDTSGKCEQPCSSYAKQQVSLCPNGASNCALPDGTWASKRYQYVPCGAHPCAGKNLSPYGSCSASCGGGSQTRSCSVAPMGSVALPPISGAPGSAPLVASASSFTGYGPSSCSKKRGSPIEAYLSRMSFRSPSDQI